MVYLNLNDTVFNLTLTLGDRDTNGPPPLLLVFKREGTNTEVLHEPSIVGIETGNRFVTYVDIPTDIFVLSGQWNYDVFDYTTPGSPIFIEKGLLIVLTTPITKKSYGIERKRGENKGHL